MFASKLARTILIGRQSLAASSFSGPSVQLIANRCYAAAAARESAMDEATAAQTDIVKNAVKDLLEQRDATRSIADHKNRTEHLQHSYQNFMNLLNEARLSIADCNESQPNHQEFHEETIQAAEAVDNVFAAYGDMLDDFRESEEELTKRFGNVREESAAALKSLRTDLVAMQRKTP